MLSQIVADAASGQARPSALSRSGRQPSWAALCLLFLVYFALALILQFASGAYSSGFGGYPDEPAHYIGGLMVHDYVLAGLPDKPVPYAFNYYRHLPEMAIGFWPPMFDLVEGAWMLLFGFSRGSALVLMAVIASAVGLLVTWHIWREFGQAMGIVSGTLWLLLPISQWTSGLIMVDTLLTLIGFSASLALASYLDRGRRRDIVLFGVLAGIALLTKTAAAYLMLAAGLTILLARRFSILLRLEFWIGPVLVALICGPWFWIARHLMSYGLLNSSVSSHLANSAAAVVFDLWRAAGWPLLLLALVGALSSLFNREGLTATTAVMIAQPLALMAVLAAAPVYSEPRYLLPAIPAVLVLACVGMTWFGRRYLPGRRGVTGLALAGGLSLVFAGPWVGSVPPDGVKELVTELLTMQPPRDRAVLVSVNEGRVVAEIAEREQHRPDLVVVRGSKLLARADWTGSGYKMRVESPEDVEASLQQVPVGYVILAGGGASGKRFPHEELLVSTLTKYPDRWQLVGHYPKNVGADRSVYALYRFAGGATPNRQVAPPFLDELKKRIEHLYK